jgi:hypothetical protein
MLCNPIHVCANDACPMMFFIEVKRILRCNRKSKIWFSTALVAIGIFAILKTSFVIVSNRRRINKISDGALYQKYRLTLLAIGIAKKDVGVNKVNSCTAWQSSIPYFIIGRHIDGTGNAIATALVPFFFLLKLPTVVDVSDIRRNDPNGTFWYCPKSLNFGHLYRLSHIDIGTSLVLYTR